MKNKLGIFQIIIIFLAFDLLFISMYLNARNYISIEVFFGLGLISVGLLVILFGTTEIKENQ